MCMSSISGDQSYKRCNHHPAGRWGLSEAKAAILRDAMNVSSRAARTRLPILGTRTPVAPLMLEVLCWSYSWSAQSR